jgi:hypothetical protein
MEATLTHQVMDERRECGEPHARARSLASPGRRAHDMRVNGPPKSGPSPRPYKRSPAASLQFIPIRFRLSSQLSRLRLLDPTPGEAE